MLYPLVPPEAQFIDPNGAPYAGGSITTYVPGTSTLASTWSNMEGTALNTNPIVLDAAGRALIYGTGNFRFVLKDAAGNLIYDQETSAVDPSGFATPANIATAVQAETDRAEAAESGLQTNINAETSRAEGAESTLQSKIDGIEHQLGGGAFQAATGITNSSGYASVTFAYPYGSTTTTASDPMVMVQAISPSAGPTEISFTVTTSLSGFTVWAADSTGAGTTIGFMWISFGTY